VKTIEVGLRADEIVRSRKGFALTLITIIKLYVFFKKTVRR